jgi:hypothetical protein
MTPEVYDFVIQVDYEHLPVQLECRMMAPGNTKSSKITIMFGISKDRPASTLSSATTTTPGKRVRKSKTEDGFISVDKLNPRPSRTNALTYTRLLDPLPFKFIALQGEYEINTYEDLINYISIDNQNEKTVSIKGKKSIQLPLFSAIKPDPKKDMFIANIGGSIWAIDWLESTSTTTNSQYLAVGGYKGNVHEHHAFLKRQVNDLENIFTIYKFDPISKHLKCDYVFLHEYGAVYDIKWCPADYDHDENVFATI